MYCNASVWGYMFTLYIYIVWLCHIVVGQSPTIMTLVFWLSQCSCLNQVVHKTPVIYVIGTHFGSS